jgi:hypothetical protein
MKHIKIYEDFINESAINESAIFDEKDKQFLCNSGERMSASQFLKMARSSTEIKSMANSSFNITKGVEAVKFLDKNLPVPIEVAVYRSEWNYGGNLFVHIGVKGLGFSTYSDAPLDYNSGSSTSGPSYSVGPYFNGLWVPEVSNSPIESGTYYGSYKAISNHQGMLEDIVKIFNAYEKRYGYKFNVNQAKKDIKERQRVKETFKAAEPKLSKILNDLSPIARKLGISIGYPYLKDGAKELRMKVDEPREYRHPDEYGGDTTSNKEYAKYENLMSKMHTELDKIAKKIGYELSIAADWGY